MKHGKTLIICFANWHIAQSWVSPCKGYSARLSRSDCWDEIPIWRFSVQLELMLESGKN